MALGPEKVSAQERFPLVWEATNVVLVHVVVHVCCGTVTTCWFLLMIGIY